MTSDIATTAPKHIRSAGAWRSCLMTVLCLLSVCAMVQANVPRAEAASAGWPTYQNGIARTGFNSGETAITAATASKLKFHWAQHAAGAISGQPIEANGRVYWGTWDGYEHAITPTRTSGWSTFLGRTLDRNCGGTSFGVAGTATVAQLGATPVVYVGGGDAHFYALNANTGQILWKTALGTSPAHFIWSSPAVYNGSVYIGLASLGDCPLVQGQFIQLNATTGAIQHVFNVVPNGCLGGSVWGAPAIDTASHTVFFATGNPGFCAVRERFAEAVVKLRTSDLSYINSWQVRGPENADLDFGSTPTLYQATIGGVSHAMLGITNKDGMYYALDRNNLGHGPLWSANIAVAGSCPECGDGSISSSAWDGTALYVGGGHTTINGVACVGSIRALNPATGAVLWQNCTTSGFVLAAITAVHGVIFIGEGKYVQGIASATGATLFQYFDGTAGSNFWGAASIVDGTVYIGNRDGALYKFAF